MLSLNQIVFNLQNLVKGGFLSDDENLSQEQMKFIVNYVRSVVIKRDVDKEKQLDPELIQDLGCVPVTMIDKAECCPEITVGCNILRSDDKIPQVLSFNHRSGITFVGDVDGGTQYQRSNYSTIIWSQYNPITFKLPMYFHKDGYIYVTGRDRSDKIRVRGMFSDPREAAKFNTCDGDPCYTDDSKYPVASWMIPVINDIIIKNELRIETIAPNDEISDARTITTPQTERGR